MLRLRTLGAWGLRLGESPEAESDLSPSKSLGLLVYLACSPGATARRERLVDLLWAHMEPDVGDHALRQIVWHLRNRLGEDSIRSAAGTLTMACPFTCDRTAFTQAVEAQDFEMAVRLYGGEFLPGFASPGGAEFERWADIERRRLESLFVLACETLARRWLSAGRFRDAVALATRARDTNRDSEAGWRLLLEALAASGDSVSGAVEAEELGRILADEHRTPEPATAAAIRQALHQQAPEGGEKGASLVTELVGRERQFTAITGAWEAAQRARGRHVHVEGAAGLGKTRLLGDVAVRLRASGASVLEVRASPGEGRVRYALAAEVAEAIGALPGSGAVAPASADALVALNPRLSSRYPAASKAAAPDRDDSRVFALALAELVEAVSEEAPVALMIDDLHWADAESRALLGALLPRVGTRRVLVVTAARPEAGGRLGGPETRYLILDPLGADHVALLLAAAGPFPPSEWAAGFAQALQRSTLGSPLLIVETLRLALSRDLLRLADGGWSSPDPVALFDLLAKGGALRQRIVDLGRERRWLLTLLAIAGVPVERVVLSEAVRRPDADFAGDLDELNRLGLAIRSGSTWVAGHDAIAEQVIMLATPEQAAAAHAALGKALMARADDAGTLRAAARHLAGASLEAELTRAATRWVRLSRSTGDRRSAAVLVADLLAAPTSDARVRRTTRALPFGSRVRRGRALTAALATAATVVVVLFGLIGPASAGPGLLVGQWRQGPGGHWRLYARDLTNHDLAAGRLELASLRRTNVITWDRPEGDLRPGDPAVVVTTGAFDDSGGEEVVVGAGDRFTRLTYTKGD